MKIFQLNPNNKPIVLIIGKWFYILLFILNFSFAQSTQQPISNTEVAICDALKAPSLRHHPFTNAAGKFTHTKLIQGTNGWVFHPKDFASFRVSSINLSYLQRLNTLLNTHGITLLLLKIPQRGQLYSDFLSSEYNSEAYSHTSVDNAYNEMIASLNSVGILAPNLLPSFNTNVEVNLFYKTDNHWNNKARELAALTIKEILLKDLDFQNLLKTPYAYRLSGSNATHGTFGDWINKNCQNQDGNYSVNDYVINNIASKLSNPSNDLFSETVSPVLLVGTSQSRPSKKLWDFSAFLEVALSVQVTNESVAGAEGYSLLNYFINSPNWNNSKSQFLIWETSYDSEYSNTLLRQILPLATNTCSTKIQSGIMGFSSDTQENSIIFENLSNIPQYSFIKLDTDTNLDRTIKIQLSYNNETEKTLTLGHPRIDSNGQFYLELLQDHTSLKKIEIELNKDSSTKNITWSICQP